MTNKRATIRLDGDTRRADKALRGTGKSVDDVEQKTRKLSKAMQEWGDTGNAASVAQDSLARGLAGLDGKAGKTIGTLLKFGTVAGGIGLAASAISGLASQAVELAHESLHTQAVFNNLSFAIDGARDVSLGLVDDMTLAEAQLRALKLGAVDTVEGYEELVGAASKVGFVMSGDAAKGVDDATTALARASPLILDNLGVTLTLTQAHQAYAEKLGKTTAQLTEHEKSQAFAIIGRERLVELSESLTIKESAALSVAQKAVVAENLRLKAMGAEVDTRTRLKTALDSLGDEVAHLNVLNKVHGADLVKVEKALRTYGVSVEDVGGLEKLQNELTKYGNQLLRERELAALEAADAEAELAKQMGLAADAQQAQLDLANLEHGISLAVAEFGANSKEAAYQSLALAQAKKTSALASVLQVQNLAKESEEYQSTRGYLQDLNSETLRRLALQQAEAEGTKGNADAFRALADAQAEIEKVEAKMRSRRGGRGSSQRSEGAQAEAIARRLELLKREAELRKVTGESQLALEDEILALTEERIRVSQKFANEEERSAALAMARHNARVAYAERGAAIDKRASDLAEQEHERMQSRLEREIEMLEARGESAEFMHRRLAQIQIERAEIVGDIDAREQAVHDERIRRMEAEQESANRVFETRVLSRERELELAEARGEDTAAQRDQLLAFEAAELESLGRVDEAREIQHQRELARLEEEQAARDRVAQHFAGITQNTVAGLAAATKASIVAGKDRGKVFAEEVKEWAQSRAEILTIEGITHLALAAVWAAALNPIKATAEATAGGIALAQAAVVGAIGGAAGAAAGASGASGSIGSGGAFNLGGGAQEPSGPGAPNSAPVSPLEPGNQPSQQSNESPGNVINVTVLGSVVGGGEILELANDAASNGGRNLRGGVG